MSEKDQDDQPVGAGKDQAVEPAKPRPDKPAAPTREDRLAEALRANLRRRKSAARTRKDG